MAAYDRNSDLRKETLRGELIRSERRSVDKAFKSLDMYLTSTRRSVPASPLDRTKFTTDKRVQDYYALSGTRRSAPNAIPETSAVVNVNHLRFERDTQFGGSMPYDGGAQYSSDTCINNYVEERRDRTHTTTFVPKDIRRNKLHATEYTDRFAPSSLEYCAKIKALYNSTRFNGLASANVTLGASSSLVVSPTSTTLTRPQTTGSTGLTSTSTASSGDNVHYARDGFGPNYFQDHTHHTRRGNHWVGIAPVQNESIYATSARGEELEFTRKCPMEDANQKILMSNKPLIHVSEGTLRVRQQLLQSQKHTSRWQSLYSSEFKDFNRPQTAV